MLPLLKGQYGIFEAGVCEDLEGSDLSSAAPLMRGSCDDQKGAVNGYSYFR